MADNPADAVQALEIGTLEDASAAVGRLLAVTGATMERRAEGAFQALRRAARAERVKLRDLAERVRPGEADPPELAEALARLREDT